MEKAEEKAKTDLESESNEAKKNKQETIEKRIIENKEKMRILAAKKQRTKAGKKCQKIRVENGH